MSPSPSARAPRSVRCQSAYTAIRDDCVLVAACDAKHAPFLLNAMGSLDLAFPDRPPLVIYDIGLSLMQRLELAAWPRVSVRRVPAFVPHWRLNWSWKLHALTDPQQRFVLYLDLANLVILRSLASWFVAIQRRGVVVLSNGQTMDEVTPSSYWAMHGLSQERMASLPTFGAGIIGFDRLGPAGQAIERAMDSVRKGLNLGRSATEPTPKYKPDIIRDCICFRADQTVLNLAFRQVFGEALRVRPFLRHVGAGGPADHPGQYIWYARRTPASLRYLYSGAGPGGAVARANRVWWRLKLGAIAWGKRVLRR